MNDSGPGRDRSVRFGGSARSLPGSILVTAAIVLGGRAPARGDDGRALPQVGQAASVPRPRPADHAPDERASGAHPTGGLLRPAADRAIVQYQGTAVAGSRITLGVDAPVDPTTSYRWVQVEGPPVDLDGDRSPTVALTVPSGTDRLAFELTLTGRGGARTVRFTVPIHPGVAAATASTAPQADAGDDQVGLVGHRVTLMGRCRTPDERVAFRWFQTGGPKAELLAQDRSYYSFTPAVSGVYRFGLVVATVGADSRPMISDPDEVVVTVGEPPMAPGSGPTGYVPTSYSATAMDQALRAASAFGNKATLDQMARTFEAISDRSSLYTSFGELTSEMMRRLDAIVPQDPPTRNLWVQGIFAPLTQHTVAELRSVGLDLGLPQNLHQELTVPQKEKLRALYGLYAREFRSRSLSR